MKWIRVCLSVVLLALVICVIAFSALTFFIDPNKLKPVIAAELQKQTGYQAVIDGKFSWSFYPTVGIKVQHIALFAPRQRTPFIDLSNITFQTPLSDLLTGNQKLGGDVYVSTIKLLNIEATNAHIGLHWQNQVLTLQPVTASIYHGSLDGVIHGSQLSLAPHWDWDINLSNIEVRPLMQDMNGAEAKLKLSGLGNLKLHGSAQGKSRDDVLSTLNGLAVFDLTNGAVEGIDLNYLVRSADALINKQPLVAPENISQTTFDKFSATATIKNGVASINDLVLTSPAIMTTGAGSINLIYQAINLQLRVTPQKDVKTQWVIPIMVTGNLSGPDVRLDATEINIMIAKEKLDKVKEKVREEIKGRFSRKTGDLLQNLLGK